MGVGVDSKIARHCAYWRLRQTLTRSEAIREAVRQIRILDDETDEMFKSNEQNVAEVEEVEEEDDGVEEKCGREMCPISKF